MTYTFVKNLFKGKFGEAFITLINGFEKVVFGVPRAFAGMVIDGACDATTSVTRSLPTVIGDRSCTGLDDTHSVREQE